MGKENSLNLLIFLSSLTAILNCKSKVMCLENRSFGKAETMEYCQQIVCEITCPPNEWDWHSLMVYFDHRDCYSSGVKVTLHKLSSVIGTNLSYDWFCHGINVVELDIDIEGVEFINTGSFAQSEFDNLTRLTLKNFELKLFPKLAFATLDILKMLTITNANISTYENGILEFGANGLNTFKLIERDNSKEILVKALLGGNNKHLNNMTSVTIQYNLINLESTSFTAISIVEELILSGCHISIIEELSFENLSKLKLLNLENNELTTLSTSIFSDLNLSPVSTIRILLSQNPWNCNCSLVQMKELLIEYSNFEGEVLCETPEELLNKPIKGAEICPSPTSIPDDASTSATTTPSPLCPEDCDNILELVCLPVESNQEIAVTLQTHRMEIITGQSTIKLESDSTNMFLIWFASEQISYDSRDYHQSKMINCVRNFSNEVAVNNLDKGVTYTFCLMTHSTLHSVSPFNCISYHHLQDENEYHVVWWHESSKPLIISVIVILLTAGALIAALLGVLFMKFYLGHKFSSHIEFDSSNYNGGNIQNVAYPTSLRYSYPQQTPLPSFPSVAGEVFNDVLHEEPDDEPYYSQLKGIN